MGIIQLDLWYIKVTYELIYRENVIKDTRESQVLKPYTWKMAGFDLSRSRDREQKFEKHFWGMWERLNMVSNWGKW